MSELEKFGIKKVIVIDDNYLSEDHRISSFPESDIINMSQQLSDLSLDIELDDFFEENPEATLGDFYETNNLTPEVKAEVLDILGGIIDVVDRYKVLKDDIGEENILSFNPKVERDMLAFGKEIETESDCTFIVLDKILDVSNQENSQELLKKILIKINNASKTNKLLFMVLYSTETPYLNNYEAVKDYLVSMTGLATSDPEYNSLTQSELPLHINFVDKKANQAEILNNFTTALRRSQKAAFTALFEVSFNKSITKMRERVWELGVNEALFYYNYLKEGQHVDNIIYDIFDANFKNYYNQEKNENYKNVINPLRKSTQIFGKERVEEMGVGRSLYSQRLRVIKDFYFYFKHKSKLLSVAKSDDISFGDVVSIQGVEYLIMSQDCDTTIRQNEGRTLDSISLLKLEKKTESLTDTLYKRLDTHRKPSGLSFTEFFNETFLANNNEEGRRCLMTLGIDLEKAEQFAKIKKRNVKQEFEDMCSESYIDGNEVTVDVKASVPNMYSIKSFWLDILLIRNEELDYPGLKSDSIVVTEESILASKEIRYATQKNLLAEFNEELNKFKDLDKDVIHKILDTQIFSNLLDIKPYFNSEDAMIGFEVREYSRVGHKDILSTMQLHSEALSSQTRIARNLEMFF